VEVEVDSAADSADSAAGFPVVVEQEEDFNEPFEGVPSKFKVQCWKFNVQRSVLKIFQQTT
jgi:hypothetical protein